MSFDPADDISTCKHRVFQVQNPVDDPRYIPHSLNILLKQYILVINHSNVDSEKLFSQYGSKHRTRLGINVMNSLLTIKMTMSTECYRFKPLKNS